MVLMKRSLRRIGMVLTASALGLVLAIVPTQFSPEQAAQALCTSSISPTCNPANIPILIEAGVISKTATGAGQAAATTSQVVAQGASKGVWGWLRSAVQGLFGVSTVVDLGGDLIRADGGLSPEGLIGQQLDTSDDPLDWPSTTAGSCSNLSADPFTGLAAGAPVPQSNCSYPARFVQDRSSTSFSISDIDVIPVNARTITLTFANATGPDQLAVRAYCGPVGGVLNLSTSYPRPRDLTTYNVSCASSTHTLHGVVIPTVNLSAVQSAPYWLVYSMNGNAALPGEVEPQTGSVSSTVKCLDPNTQAVTTITDSAPRSFLPGETVTIPDLRCPVGLVAIGTDVDWMPDTGTPIKIIEDTGDQVTPQQKELVQANPACWTSTTACTLLLTKTDGTSCGNIGELCPDWAKDPNYTQNYRCTYGGQLVSINMCSAYRDPTRGIQPNTGTNGELLPPTAAPSNIQTPKPGSTTAPQPQPANPDFSKCRPSSLLEALNPFFVFQAVQCALETSFVPRDSFVKSTLASMRTAWNATAVVKTAQAISTLEFAPPNVAGCHGITVSVFFLGPPFQIMNACPGSALETMAMWSRIFGNVMFTVYGVIGVSRHISRIIGYGGLGESS